MVLMVFWVLLECFCFWWSTGKAFALVVAKSSLDAPGQPSGASKVSESPALVFLVPKNTPLW